MSCTLECYRTLTGAFCSVLLKILTRKARIAAGRVRGLRVNSYAESIAMATLLVLLMIGGVEPHPGPTDDKIANGKRDSTSSASDDNHNDRGNAISPPTVDQLFAAISELSQAVNRVEAAQAALSTQQTHNTAAVQQRLAEVEKKLDERLKTLEDSNDVLSADVGEMSTKVEQLEEENQFIKDGLRNLEEKLDSAENHSKRNNLLFYGIPTAAGETWSDCEDKVMNIIKTDMKITDGVAIERAHRVGKAKLLSYKDKEKILKGAKNLASTNKDISVREDFSQAVQTKRSKLVPVMKTLRKDGKRARLRFDKLVTDDGTFTFNLQTNLIEKLDGDRRSRSKTTADWNGSGNTIATMRPATATATCGETRYTDRNTRAAADDTLVGMAVRSTHLARARSADSGHASWGQRSGNSTRQCPSVEQASETMGLRMWVERTHREWIPTGLHDG